MAASRKRYVGEIPVLSEFISHSNAVSGGDLLVGKGVDRSDGSFEGVWVDSGLLR